MPGMVIPARIFILIKSDFVKGDLTFNRIEEVIFLFLIYKNLFEQAKINC